MTRDFIFALTTAVLLFSGQPTVHADEPPAIKVNVIGSGPPMILIPGLTCGTNVWNGTVAHFKDHYQLHVLTLAGFAGQPPIKPPFLPSVCDAIVKYIHTQKLDHPVIIGHSLGGMMAYWVAEKAPADVGPIIAVDGLPFLSAMFDPNATAESSKANADQFRSMYKDMSQEQFATGTQQFLGMMITAPSNLDMVMSLAGKSNPQAVGQAFYELSTTDLRTDAKNIKAPVLLIGSDAMANDDEQKKGFHAGYAAQIAKIPHHKLVFAPKARHFIQLDEPDFFYREVETFLKENAAK